jgi:hypothetical protein
LTWKTFNGLSNAGTNVGDAEGRITGIGVCLSESLAPVML